MTFHVRCIGVAWGKANVMRCANTCLLTSVNVYVSAFVVNRFKSTATHETRKLRREERMLLRKQIKEFHVQRLGRRPHVGGSHTVRSVPLQ